MSVLEAMNPTFAVTIPERLKTALESNVGSSEFPRWALEAMVVEAVREGLISRGFGGDILGLGFYAREELYARRGVVYDYTEEDLDAQEKDLLSMLTRK